MSIPSRQIGWGTESNLLWQILKQLNKLTSVLFGLKEAATPNYKVYTALLTQTGSDSPTLAADVPLVIGFTYEILDDDSGTADFTNVGAPNNNIGTFFVATGTTPTSWGINLLGQLLFNSGAPTAIVLENTIGNIWFTYANVGQYLVYSNNLFTINKTVIDIDAYGQDGNAQGGALIANTTLNPIDKITIYTSKGSQVDDLLQKNRLEIRVYN